MNNARKPATAMTQAQVEYMIGERLDSLISYKGLDGEWVKVANRRVRADLTKLHSGRPVRFDDRKGRVVYF